MKLTAIYMAILALMGVASVLAMAFNTVGCLAVDIIALAVITWFALECARTEKEYKRYGTRKENR